MKATRIFALILACIMLCSCFLVSCGEEKKTNTAEAVTPTVDTEDKSEVYEAEVKNLNGHTFHFVTRDGGNNWHLSTQAVYAEEVTGDKVNDAVFNRNAQLEKLYNCKITQEAYNNPVTQYRESLIAGDYVCDYIMFTVNSSKSLMTGGLLVDFKTLKNIDLTKAWWDQEGNHAFNMGMKYFFITGDAATMDDRSAWMLAFNRDIIAEWDPNFNIYETVKKGEWTVDLMAKIIAETKRDLNDDGKIATQSKDRFGYTAEAATNWWLLAACGVKVSSVNAAGEYTIPDELPAEVLSAWQACKGLIATDGRFNSDSGWYMRASGLSTFYSCNYGMALKFTDAQVPVGYLPLPKLNKEQANYLNTVSFSQCGGYMIPSTIENAEVQDWKTNGFESAAEQAAYFLEAFAYYSRHTVTPAFVDLVLLKQAVFDGDSADMITLSLAHKVYDPIISKSFGSINIFSKAGTASKPGNADTFDSINTLYKEKVEAARTSLAEYITFINTDTLAPAA